MMAYPETETGWKITVSVEASTRDRAIELFKQYLGHLASSGYQHLGGGGGADKDHDGKFIKGSHVSWIASVEQPRQKPLNESELRTLRAGNFLRPC